MKIPMLVMVAVGASALAFPAVAAPKPAEAFLQEAIKSNNSEIALGTLAQKQAQSSKVRDFGATLVQDHQKAKEEAVKAAKSKGVAVPAQIKPEAQAEMTKLRGLSGQAFDREFVNHMVMDHNKNIALFEEQAKAGDATTAQLAQKTLPDLRKHLEIAKTLQQ